ncbi:rhomboid family intramembrane serine protease [Pseudomonadota bacterium]
MQFDIPDPAYTRSDRAYANFRLAFKFSLWFVVVLWVVFLLDKVLMLELGHFGVRPRELDGLLGILFAPLLHGSFSHLISNTLPLLVLGTGMLYLYPNSAVKVILAVYLGSGLAVWLLARPSIHIGASGLIYGFASYIFVSGIIRRDVRAIAAAMLVCFLYGTLIWGVLPIETGVSWETHLVAALIGLLLAILTRHSDTSPRKRYTWEDEDD